MLPLDNDINMEYKRKVFVLICMIFVNFICETKSLLATTIHDFPYLPPLLKFQNGSIVSNEAQWKVRKEEISELLQEYILGTVPKEKPKLINIELVNKTSNANENAISSFFYLTFKKNDSSNNNSTASFYVELLSPIIINKKNDEKTNLLPLFLTQWNHREWGLIGVSRGYVSMIYPGSDTRDASPLFQNMYQKEYTMKLILARAFVASLSLDFIFEYFNNNDDHGNNNIIDLEKICITGHSRNGKQSLIAAAFDERIGAVVGSSPGAPVASPYHISSHNFYGEGPDAGRAGQWWNANVLNFTNHPEQLPMDGHGIVSMIAPRSILIASGYTDHEGDLTFANEYSIVENLKVFETIYNKPENINILHRPGDHHGFISVDSYFDFFDSHFNIKKGKNFRYGYYQSYQQDEKGMNSNYLPLRLLTPAGFEWHTWEKAFKGKTPKPPPSLQDNLLERVNWLLQLDNSTRYIRSVGTNYAEDAMSGVLRYPSVMMGHDLKLFNEKDLRRMAVSFGNYVTANVYWYADNSGRNFGAKRPAIIWLHPYSYSTGYYASYERGGLIVDNLARAGYVVLAYDQIGFGTRLLEGGSTFYARHGNAASLFGVSLMSYLITNIYIMYIQCQLYLTTCALY